MAVAGLLAYLLPFYSIFGSQTSGFEQTFVSPGIGFFVAGMGIFLGIVSPADRPECLSTMVHALHTCEGLSKLGAFFTSVGLALDVLNHWALGQLPDFIGLTTAEQFLHWGLAAGVTLMLVLTTLRSRVSGDRYFIFISAATLALLGADAVYSGSTGNLHDFLGHNLTETVLHLSVYYGVALATIGGLLGLDKSRQ